MCSSDLGKFSAPILMALETKQQQWGLASEIAASIRQEVLRPYEEFAAKLQKYQQVLQQELQPGNRLSAEAWKDLHYFQQTLGLTDENVQPLVKQVKILPAQIAPPRIVKPQADHSKATAKQSSRVVVLEHVKTQTGAPRKSSFIPILLIIIANVSVLSLGLIGDRKAHV